MWSTSLALVDRAPGSAVRRSVPVVSGLEGAVGADVDVRGLVGGELGELGAQLVQVQGGHLLVQVLGQDVHLLLVAPGLALVPQLQLGDDLRGQKGDSVTGG